MREELFRILWEEAKGTYPPGESGHVNAILEEDFEKVIDKIINLCNKAPGGKK